MMVLDACIGATTVSRLKKKQKNGQRRCSTKSVETSLLLYLARGVVRSVSVCLDVSAKLKGAGELLPSYESYLKVLYSRPGALNARGKSQKLYILVRIQRWIQNPKNIWLFIIPTIQHTQRIPPCVGLAVIWAGPVNDGARPANSVRCSQLVLQNKFNTSKHHVESSTGS